MNLLQTDRRIHAHGASSFLHPEFVIFLLLIQFALCQLASAQPSDAFGVTDRPPFTTEQVVHHLAEMNLRRLQALHAYQGTRTYRAEYHGLGGARSAEMVVKVKYLSPNTKEFVIQSATGSKLIIDKVFKKLLEAETEALDTEMQRRSALTEDNYKFTLTGYESGTTGGMYVLSVEPRTKDKFLYRGHIWVDATDFAVVRLEAEPSKSPSFWTKKAEVVQEYKKVNDFWLPAHNQSVSAIRVGGRAELTIDYRNYEITRASQVGSLRMLQAMPYSEIARANRDNTVSHEGRR